MAAAVCDQDRFEAAVKIIGGLPKDGPFQPSNEMKLKFYALFKQATFGPCTAPQPGFWDVVNKAKWTAWKSLGDMAKDEAMRNYVDALKQVVETMTLDADVQDFLDKIGPMYEFVNADDDTQPKSQQIAAKKNKKGAAAAEKRIHNNNNNNNNNNNGPEELVNGGHHLKREKVSNGRILVVNGGEGRDHRSEDEDEEEADSPDIIRAAVQGRTAVSKIDDQQQEDGGVSEEEKFDDASDSQVFPSSVAFDTGPVESSPVTTSSEHSPFPHLSSSSATVRCSRAVQSSCLSNPATDGTSQMMMAATLSPSRRRAAAAFGQLLRELPNMVMAASPAGDSYSGGGGNNSNYDVTSLVRAWTALRRIHADQVRRLERDEDEDWFVRRLLAKRAGGGKRPAGGKSGHRKHRGGGNGGGGGSGNGGNGAGSSGGGGGGGANHRPGDGTGTGAGAGAGGRRGTVRHHSSGEESASNSSSNSGSSGGTAPDGFVHLGGGGDLDANVGSVLLRMHRELQHINRQLQFVEGVLITQQEMMRELMADRAARAQRNKMRLCFFIDLPWRTIAFILAWPVVVHILIRIGAYKLRRRK